MTTKRYPVGIEGELIRLIPVDPEHHLENVFLWMNDPSVTAGLSVRGPFTRNDEQQWFDRVAKNDNERVWAIIFKETEEHVGFTTLFLKDTKNGIAGTGIVINPDYWDQGIATEVMQLRTKFAFEELRIHRLETGALKRNKGSWRAMEKAGYRYEGTQRKTFFADGRWHDMKCYAMLAEDYFAMKRGGNQ